MAGLFDGTDLQQPVTCAVCREPRDQCACPRSAGGEVCHPADQPARVRREKRRGKWVTVVYQLDPSATDLKALAKLLKQKCSAGGSDIADGVEVQGDHRDKIIKILIDMGYPAKAAGG